jgi:hypothetical protein
MLILAALMLQGLGCVRSDLRGVTLPEDVVRREANRAVNETARGNRRGDSGVLPGRSQRRMGRRPLLSQSPQETTGRRRTRMGRE